MTVRIGMIGLGAMGRAHLDRLRTGVPDATVVAVSDLDAAVAGRVAREFDAPACADSAALIASPDVDAVMICSSGPAHSDDVLAAIEAGKPVFCEKPLAPTARECRAIMQAEQDRRQRLVTVGFMRRFDASYLQLRDALASGGLGEPLIVHSRHHNPSTPGHYTRTMSITDTAIHDVDIVRWLLAQEFRTARVDRPRTTRHRPAHLQDPLLLVLTTDAGVWVGVEIFVNNRRSYDIGCEVVAESGTVRLGGDQPPGMDHNARFGPAFLAQLRQWVAGIEAGQQIGPTAWDGYAAAAVCDAGVAALAGEETVPVELIERPGLYWGR